jgi:diamine N-acetyltransferase
MIALRVPTDDDKRPAFEWMTMSDATPSMIGPPHFPEQPLPTWEEFLADWVPHYWDHNDPERGRVYIITRDGESVGLCAHSEVLPLEDGRRAMELDIWLRSLADTGQGTGSEAIRLLCQLIHDELDISVVVMQPSRRNPRALRAYEKSGFADTGLGPEEGARRFSSIPDYKDSVWLLRELA